MEEKYMELALDLAKKAMGKTSPNPMVGAVIVKNGKIIGKGYHQKAGLPHGERIALEEAGEQAKGADLYVTLEPCNHYGKTPPCTDAIIKAGIKNVYIAHFDPNPLVSGTGVKKLLDAGINVVVGIKEEEARELNEVFFKYITTGLPFIALKAACSLDGKIATYSGVSKWITSQEAREHSHQLRNMYDAIMVGIGTIIKDNPRLNCRLKEGRDPIRIIVDSKLRIPEEAHVLNLNSNTPTIIATTCNICEYKYRKLCRKAEIIKVNSGNKVDLFKLMRILAKKGITGILVEGGATLNSSLFNMGLVDKYYLYYAPLIIGGLKAPGFIGGKGAVNLEEAVKLKNISLNRLGNDFFLTAYPD